PLRRRPGAGPRKGERAAPLLVPRRRTGDRLRRPLRRGEAAGPADPRPGGGKPHLSGRPDRLRRPAPDPLRVLLAAPPAPGGPIPRSARLPGGGPLAPGHGGFLRRLRRPAPAERHRWL